MAGVREGGGPPQPLHPKEHMSTWGGCPSVSCFPPPTAPMAQGATGGGGSPSISESQLDSGSDSGLLVHSGTHSLCHLFF